MRPRFSLLAFILAYHIPFSSSCIVANIASILLPFILHISPRVSGAVPKMRSPSVDPTSNSFRANLKELSATDRNLQNENFKLKMQLYHMRVRLKKARADEDRRESYATPKIDNFYEEDNEDDSSHDVREKFDDDGFESDNQVIRVLQDKLEEKDNTIANLEEENKSLWDSHDDMKRQMKDQTIKFERLEAARSSLHAKVEGSRLQIDAAVEAMEEAQNDAQESRNRLAEANLQIKQEQAQVRQWQDDFENERRLHEATGTVLQGHRSELSSIRRNLEDVIRERNAARHTLHVEKERREIWEATRGSKGGRENWLTGESNHMELLLARLDQKRLLFETNENYDENWREGVNEYLKDCLEALYRLEVEVDAKRRDFLMNKSNHLLDRGRSILA